MRVLRILAFPFSLLYGLVVYLRNRCFDFGILGSKSYAKPLICIGNLSVGGTGKTPMVEYLISVLQNEFNVAVLSRGYRRKSKGFLLANKASTVQEIGDEPFQIYNKFPHVAIAVDVDRQHGISQLEKEIDPDLVLLDDAFQHRKVRAGLNILLTLYSNLYIDDWYLPTGNLRDSKQEAKRADYIIVTKCPMNLSESEQTKIQQRLKSQKHQKVLFSCLKYDVTLKAENKEQPIGFLKDKTFTLVTGIAQPKPLVDFLTSKSLTFEHVAFKDHHFFTPNQLETLNSKEMILTTEKDYVRLMGHVKNLYFIGIRHEFLGKQEEIFKKGLNDFMKRSS